MPRPSKILVLAAFAALYLVWGSTYLAILFAIETIPPLLMAGTRFLLAGFIMYAIARGQGKQNTNGDELPEFVEKWTRLCAKA